MPPMRVFGGFLQEQNATWGTGAKPLKNQSAETQSRHVKNVSFPPALRWANQPCIGQMHWHRRICEETQFL